ncbi:MAG: hypothetical protein L6265_02055 [Thermoplasmatales archaeon]|nr:hypothetical protein [Thermoplasmatales archaeon]
MVNIIFFGGTGRMGEDCEFKYGIGKYLPDDWDVIIVSRVKEAKKYIKDEKKVKFEYIYDDEIFKRKLDKSEIEDAEKWLGHPLRALKHYSRSIKDVHDKELEKNVFEFAAKHILFWKKYFKEKKPDIFSTTLISELHETIPLIAAKKANVKAINLFPGRVTNSNTLTDVEYNIIGWNKENYNSDEIDEYYDRIKSDYIARKQISYPYMSEEVLRNLAMLSPRISLKKIRQLREYMRYKESNKPEICLESTKYFISEYLKSVFRRVVVRNLFKPLEKGRKFFFFPLHYQIDAQMLYREPFFDQYDLVEQISHCLPYETLLYVKAHPHWGGSDVEYKRAKQLSKIQNIRFIPPTTSPYCLIDNAFATITINSTTGFEAVILNKPVITFGHEIYAKEGVSIIVRDLKDLPDIIFNIMKDPNYGIDINKRKELIYKVFKNTIRLEGKFGLDYLIYTENDYKNIAEAYVKAYKNYKII